MHVTAGRVVLSGTTAKRLKQKIPDFILYFRRDTPIAVVEAKSDAKPAANGVQQAKEYAALLGLKFAYATTAPTSSRSTPSRGQNARSRSSPRPKC